MPGPLPSADDLKPNASHADVNRIRSRLAADAELARSPEEQKAKKFMKVVGEDGSPSATPSNQGEQDAGVAGGGGAGGGGKTSSNGNSPSTSQTQVEETQVQQNGSSTVANVNEVKPESVSTTTITK